MWNLSALQRVGGGTVGFEHLGMASSVDGGLISLGVASKR